MTTKQAFVRELLETLRKTPTTSGKFSPADRRLAERLFDQGVPLDTINHGLLLATARRIVAAADPNLLPPVRSLAYFLHTIEEVRRSPLEAGYLAYLRSAIRRKLAATAVGTLGHRKGVDPAGDSSSSTESPISLGFR